MDEHILRHVQVFCTQLRDGGKVDQGWGQPRNVSSLCNFLMFDIMGDLSFGNESFQMLTKTDNHFVVKLIETATRRQAIVSSPPRHLFSRHPILG